ncbi:hypothetical protein [Staphylococcus hominis]|uniref:hypothetical protein n=1 Tax=Staphylococcus hominis TaxID=1290 RepID=UPI000DFC8B41|nr:hypothetical protein [Staphylococcus hominis]SUM72757.1 Uncharacterised protein [Staphylococcus hominis]
MFEYKTIPLDKTRVLMMNGIYKIDAKDNNDEFVQYNDFLKHKTFYQCSKCKSLNVEVNNIFVEEIAFTNTKQCLNCGHLVVSNFEEDKNG